jgi:hypothetical protein
MGGCCSRRDKLENFDGGIILPLEKRNQFKGELQKAVNKDHLHNEILAQQTVLDFESYKSVMGLVSAYVSELTIVKNQHTFPQRIALLKKIQSDKLPAEGPEQKEYHRLIVDLFNYQQKLQQELIDQVQKSLDITDQNVLMNSHETYEMRQ